MKIEYSENRESFENSGVEMVVPETVRDDMGYLGVAQAVRDDGGLKGVLGFT